MSHFQPFISLAVNRLAFFDDLQPRREIVDLFSVMIILQADLDGVKLVQNVQKA